MATKLLLAVYGLFAAVAATATRAATELPGITVTGKVTPSGDIVNRDRDQRSPDILWPPGLSLKLSEVLTRLRSMRLAPRYGITSSKPSSGRNGAHFLTRSRLGTVH